MSELVLFKKNKSRPNSSPCFNSSSVRQCTLLLKITYLESQLSIIDLQFKDGHRS
jgi:hypothetical protein